MNSKKNKKIDNLSIHFDIDAPESKTQTTSPITEIRETQALKTINYLEIENERLSRLYHFLDTTLGVQKSTGHTDGLIKELNFELLTIKTEVYASLTRDGSPLFQNIEYLWEKTFL